MVQYELENSAYTDLLPEVLFHKIIIQADKKERPLPDGNKHTTTDTSQQHSAGNPLSLKLLLTD
jgi:hypothetical protein